MTFHSTIFLLCANNDMHIEGVRQRLQQTRVAPIRGKRMHTCFHKNSSACERIGWATTD
jgi:hypothetical protein